MNKRLIVTDSTCDLPDDIVSRYGIHVMPVNVILDGKSYRDGVDMSRDEFYEHYDEYKHLSTSAVSYEDYTLDFGTLVGRYDELLIIIIPARKPTRSCTSNTRCEG